VVYSGLAGKGRAHNGERCHFVRRSQHCSDSDNFLYILLRDEVSRGVYGRYIYNRFSFSSLLLRSNRSALHLRPIIAQTLLANRDVLQLQIRELTFSLIHTLIKLEWFHVAEYALVSLIPSLYESPKQQLLTEAFILLADCQIGIARHTTGIRRHIQINKAINLLDHGLDCRFKSFIADNNRTLTCTACYGYSSTSKQSIILAKKARLFRTLGEKSLAVSALHLRSMLFGNIFY
jgi:hypothetical protein